MKTCQKNGKHVVGKKEDWTVGEGLMINTKCTFSTKYNSSLNASLQVTSYIYSLSNYTK